MTVRELYETLIDVEAADLQEATLDELIDTKRELEKMLRAVESHLMARREGN